MKILIATDAWLPQVNSVVTTLKNTVRELERLGHTVKLITAEGFRTFACPTYPEVRLALAPGARVIEAIEAFGPDAVHIATEAPLPAGIAYAQAINSPPPITPSSLSASRRVRLSQPHRYLWTGADRSHGVWNTRGRIPGSVAAIPRTAYPTIL